MLGLDGNSKIDVTQHTLQARLECNIFHRYRNRAMTFLVLQLPVFGFTLLRGLININNLYLDGL